MLAKYSLIQLKTGRNPRESFKTLDSLIRKAADKGVNFVSTPETTNIMELKGSRLFKKITAEKDDIFLKKLRALAKELNLWINLGSWIVKAGKNKASNRTILIDSDGRIHSRYDKIHLFDVEKRSPNEPLNNQVHSCKNLTHQSTAAAQHQKRSSLLQPERAHKKRKAK